MGGYFSRTDTVPQDFQSRIEPFNPDIIVALLLTNTFFPQGSTLNPKS